MIWYNNITKSYWGRTESGHVYELGGTHTCGVSDCPCNTRGLV